MAECEENFKACTAARTARIQQGLADNPHDTDTELARKLNVHRHTIRNERQRLLQSVQPCTNCNKPEDEAPTCEELPAGVFNVSKDAAAAIAHLSGLTKEVDRIAVKLWIKANWH